MKFRPRDLWAMRLAIVIASVIGLTAWGVFSVERALAARPSDFYARTVDFQVMVFVVFQLVPICLGVVGLAWLLWDVPKTLTAWRLHRRQGEKRNAAES